MDVRARQHGLSTEEMSGGIDRGSVASNKGGFMMKPPSKASKGTARMPDEQEQAIVPVEQDTVPFYDRQIIAARLPDGRIAASLRNMCDALQLERYSQVRRIRDDDILVDQLVPVRVETDGGAQTVEMLTAWAIPTWLT